VAVRRGRQGRRRDLLSFDIHFFRVGAGRSSVCFWLGSASRCASMRFLTSLAGGNTAGPWYLEFMRPSLGVHPEPA
jgi:hypothetical protein